MTKKKEPETKKEKGLLVYVYRKPNGTDCTHGGISSKYDKFILIGEGIEGTFEPTEEIPAIYLKQIEGYLYINGVKESPFLRAFPPNEENKWYQFGGNFVYACDSRFPARYPIPIFDRCEE